jgi:hypothetical protein
MFRGQLTKTKQRGTILLQHCSMPDKNYSDLRGILEIFRDI